MTSAIRSTALAGVGGLVVALAAVGAPAAAGTSAAPALSATAAASDPERSVREPYLRRGSRGQAVAAWQRALNDWLRAEGRARLATDGIFGPKTDAATRALQRASGIAVDGIARGVGYPADTGVAYPRLERVPTPGAGVVEDLYVGTLFEGQQDVVVGVSLPEEYRVFPLDDPTRLVVDIAHPSAG